MKSLLKARYILPIVAIILVVAAGTALAVAWATQHMTATGTITVNEPPPAPDYSYTLSSNVLAFADQTVDTNAVISNAATVTLNNTGNQDIAGFVLTNVAGVPAGLSLDVSGGPITAGNSGTVTFTLTGIAPAAATTLDLTAISCDLQPN